MARPIKETPTLYGADALMKDLQKLGILDYKSVKTISNETSERNSFTSYFKVKPGSNTAPRLNTRLVKMPEGLL